MSRLTTASIDVARLTEIDRLAERELADTGLPGLAIGLTGADGPPEIRTCGLADLAARRPIRPDTLFEIGSIGKTFTAIAILQLVEEGRLDLDAPVVDAALYRAKNSGRNRVVVAGDEFTDRRTTGGTSAGDAPPGDTSAGPVLVPQPIALPRAG